MRQKTTGTVIAVSKQWWMKVNTKPVRMIGADGAVYPHIVSVFYTVDGTDYTKRKWLAAGIMPPSVGAAAAVEYEREKLKKARVV